MKTISTVATLFLLIMSVFGQQEVSGTIEIEIINIENSKGKIMIGLYDSQENWLEKIYKGTYGKIENGKATAIFEHIPNGIYAISVFHDEDDDGKLNTFLGIPTESTASSNNALARFGPPMWDDAKFELKAGVVKQQIKL